MSARKNIENEIFGDIWVLEFDKKSSTHALWKCLCMRCNKLIHVTASNLKSGNTKSCKSCGQKTTNYKQEHEILSRLYKGDKIAHIARDFEIDRGIVYRIKKDAES